MLFLLDTHTLLWWLADSPSLPDSARERIANPDHDVYVRDALVFRFSVRHASAPVDAAANETALVPL